MQIAMEEKGLKYESKLISFSESATPLLDQCCRQCLYAMLMTHLSILIFILQRGTRATKSWHSILVAK